MSELQIFELLKVCDSLKHLKRTGWTKFEIEDPEAVACHMYRMAVLSMSLRGQIDNLDTDKCIKMSLVHDIAEALVGDITPHCGVSDEDKYEKESKAIQQIAAYVPKDVGDDWILLWKSYENQDTLESKVVKHLDKFDMVVQAFDYEQKYGVNLSQFFASTVNSFTMQPFVKWNTELREKRSKWLTEKSGELHTMAEEIQNTLSFVNSEK